MNDNKWKFKTRDLIDNFKVFNKLNKYVELILKYNQHFNLTGFDENTIWKNGIYQSIELLNSQIKNENDYKLLDIGAGCGFPSIPFLIAKLNRFHLTIIESNAKRVNFLNIVKRELNLTNLNVINKRAEEIENQHYETFDFITARAVSSLKVLIEISSPYGKLNAKYFFLKSSSIIKEIGDAKEIIDRLNIKNYEYKKIDIGDAREHIIFTYKKNSKTPSGYPRKWNVIIQ